MATAYNFTMVYPESTYPNRFEPSNAFPSLLEFEFTQASAAFVTNDTITTPLNGLPTSGIRIAEVEVLSGILDTSGSPSLTFEVGDVTVGSFTGVVNRYITSYPGSSSVASSQIKAMINQPQTLTAGVVSAGVNFLYGASNAGVGNGTTGPQLVMTINSGPATGSTTATVRLKVWYWCTGEE